ncbi:HEPN domain-containing protein [Cryobacterium shii]|uniref:HEPN domain-containing protein n=1 Tax=Cryobacterium shii TaxID=1259235 RepID=A0AAQ2C7E9_9MICO|nr:HEPN domain-containing protein [Cryobacterium shii]
MLAVSRDAWRVHREEWQELAVTRLAEAESLLLAGHWSGAYYLCGYAVECGIKSRLATQFKAETTPNRAFVNDIHVHDLAKLVRLADLHSSLLAESATHPGFEVAWSVAKDWNESSRYRVWEESEARDMVRSIADEHGVFEWVKKQW